AREAGAIGVGVLGGAADRETLAPWADVLIDDIEAIRPV
ncbi:MAG: HAD family hydrolase, partial [Actinobacteria bacterium]|nr:HAD family hydrolase [Actinomycetota bacterium]NIS34484.1 HAD family hydrolase [Actinomycetota bacterium]NIT97523.1 HAD family hydrolase [Actinomycetota bacterium]NIU21188.1 HAD family hydrolase [Actinomycetota bacterium]NIU69254.1 HAD family hydrolase [Actinomycetota bacterium]